MAPLCKGSCLPQQTEGLSLPWLPFAGRKAAEGRAFWRKEYGVLFSENKPTATPAQLEELSRCEECKGSCPPQRTEGLSLPSFTAPLSYPIPRRIPLSTPPHPVSPPKNAKKTPRQFKTAGASSSPMNPLYAQRNPSRSVISPSAAASNAACQRK